MNYRQSDTRFLLLRLVLLCGLLAGCSPVGGLLAGSQSPSLLSGSDWAIEGGSPARSRASADVVALPLRLAQNYEIGGDTQFASPVGIAQGALLADGEQVLYVLDAANGEERWRFNLTGFFLSPTVADNRVFVRSESGEDGFVYALTLDTGAKLWQFRFPAVGSPYDNVGGHVTSPLVAANRVLVGASQSLYALDVETGAVAWEYALQSPIASSVAVADDFVFVSDFTHLYALSLENGAEAWRFDFDTVSLFFAPVVLADQVIITSYDTVYSLHRESGALAWAKQLPDMQLIPAGAYGEQVYVKSTNTLVALDRSSGAELWRYATLNFISLPAATEDHLYVIDRFGDGSHLLALGRADGQEAWRSDKAQLARSAPIVAQGRLIVRTENGQILIYQ